MNEKVTGLVLVGIVCTSQVLGALTSRIAVQSLNAPFFLMWIHTLMMVLMWPLGLVIETMPVISCNKTTTSQNRNRIGGDIDDSRTERIALLVQEARRKVPRMLHLVVLLFYPLWIAANYCYIAALKHVPASTMVSIFGSCTAFVSVEEAIWLRRHCTIVRAVAVLLAFGGVVVYGILGNSSSSNHGSAVNGSQIIGIDDGETAAHEHTLLLGVLLGTCSSLAAATYKVAFKKFLGSPTKIDVCLFLSVLGMVNSVMGAVPTLILAHSGAEQSFYDSGLKASSWGVIWAGSVFILVFNASIAFGIALTSPLFIAVGTVLTIPVTEAIDYFWIDPDKAFVGTGQVAASAAIVASFVVISIFDQQHSVVALTLVESESDVGVAGSAVEQDRNNDEE